MVSMRRLVAETARECKGLAPAAISFARCTGRKAPAANAVAAAVETSAWR
ncbi:MAG TPA: hypothetical protein GX405_09125 [Rhizobiales bacterium]|nr:hypothetical protein [Hyphomicrobiales bacterium]